MLACDIVPAELKLHVQDRQALWREAAERVRTLNLRLGEDARKRRALIKRVETVPGVDPIVALAVLAVFAEGIFFPSAKHPASYGWLVPSTFQSGERDAHGHITARLDRAAGDAVAR